MLGVEGMTDMGFGAITTRPLGSKHLPRTIVLPALVARSIQGAKLEADADPKHLERGGAIFATKTGDIRIRRTEVSDAAASMEAMTVDRSPNGTTDKVLAEFHVHPRYILKPQFVRSDPPGSEDFDNFARHADRLQLIRSCEMTYAILKTAEYDDWFSRLPKDPRTQKPFYQNDLGFAFRQYLAEARSRKGITFPHALLLAAIKVAKHYHLALYVGDKTTVKRIDDLKKGQSFPTSVVAPAGPRKPRRRRFGESIPGRRH
jgi:hypothetical protein